MNNACLNNELKNPIVGFGTYGTKYTERDVTNAIKKSIYSSGITMKRKQ